jgi:hypothetical protein
MKKKEKFKKYAIKALWIILYCFLCYVFISSALNGIDAIFYDICGGSVFFDVSKYVDAPKGMGVAGVGLLFLSSYINELSLYIWSYKIYTGKNNWYKFYRDREKQQKLQNKLDYQNYIKENKNR